MGHALFKAVAAKCAKDRIRVNSLNPGPGSSLVQEQICQGPIVILHQ